MGREKVMEVMGAPGGRKRSFRLSTLRRNSELTRTSNFKRMPWPLLLFVLAATIEDGFGKKLSKNCSMKTSRDTSVWNIPPTSRAESPANTPFGPGGNVSFNLVNGMDADIEEFPFYALLTKSGEFIDTLRKGGSLHVHCGSSLIHPKFLISAWHCVKYHEDPKDYVAVFHVTNRCHLNRKYVEWRFAHKIYFYPGSTSSATIKRSDIILIELRQEVTDITPVLLPTQPPTVGTIGTVIGFGRTVWVGSKNLPCVLRKTFEAVEAWKKCHHSSLTVIGSFCGVATSTVACRGDSGGPWLTWSKGDYELQGVVSFGASRCESSEANDFYTNVYSYSPWITETIRYVTFLNGASQLAKFRQFQQS